MEQLQFTFGWGDAPSGYGYLLADADLFGPPSVADEKETGGIIGKTVLPGGGELLSLGGELVRPLEPVASPQIREATHTVIVNESANAVLRAKIFGTAPLGIGCKLTIILHTRK